MGRGNTCELGRSDQTDPIVYGAARNPWDPSLAPGASSGSSAAAVAAEVVSRSVRDNAAAPDVSSGPAGGDVVPLARAQRPFLEEISREPAGLRVALCTPISGGE